MTGVMVLLIPRNWPPPTLMIATSNGVCPFSSVAFTFAPASKSTSMIAILLPPNVENEEAAKCKADHLPLGNRAFKSALLDMSSSIISLCPLSVALSKAVPPLLSLAFTFVPACVDQAIVFGMVEEVVEDGDGKIGGSACPASFDF